MGASAGGLSVLRRLLVLLTGMPTSAIAATERHRVAAGDRLAAVLESVVAAVVAGR